MQQQLLFTLTPLTDRHGHVKDGAAAALSFLKQARAQFKIAFNGLVSIHFDDPAVLQQAGQQPPGHFAHLLLVASYASWQVISLLAVAEENGVVIATAATDHRELKIGPAYREATYQRKLSEAELSHVFDYLFSHPEKLQVKEPVDHALVAAAYTEMLRELPDDLAVLATIIRDDWKNVYFGAVPYLDAMATLSSIKDMYHSDTAKSIVNYFLSNAKSWRGETATAVKKKLRELVKTA